MLTTRKGTPWFVPLLAALAMLPASAAAQDIGMLCTESLDDSFDLQATSGYIQTPDGNSIFMWGFAPAEGLFQIPGPVLCVTEGDTVSVNLTNNLLEPVSIVFPGQRGVQASEAAAPSSDGLLTLEAEPGGTVSYSFTASAPGTYLYESGTVRHKQVHMGLYGVLVVRPALGPNFAYNDPETAFSGEFLLVLHEIDSDLHRAVELGQTFDQTTRRDRYWTINGRSMPDTIQANFPFFPLLPSQPFGALVRVEAIDRNDGVPDPDPVLIRYANAGSVNHPFHPHGDHLLIIAQDGRPLGEAQVEAFTRTIAAGQTFDLLFTWENVEAWQTSEQEGNGPVPVQVPGLQNLVFKDDVTFYSGEEHLGFNDTLPPAVTSFNECGEFYFPWHSHALHTVQNFDEGFGGMLTLVRIDPPGGCP